MAEVWGSLKWDDDDLTPGNSKDGGLHNNLYDSDGKLKGAASFIPGDKSDRGSERQPANPRGKDVEQRRDRAKDQVVEFVADVVHDALVGLADEATPHVKRFLDEKVVPAIKTRSSEAGREAGLLLGAKARPLIERQRERMTARKTQKSGSRHPIVVEGTVVDPGQ